MTLGEAITLAGYLVGFVVFLLASRRDGFDSSAMLRLGGVGLVSGAIGARLVQAAVGGGPLLSTEAGGRTIVAGIVFGWIGVEVAKRFVGLQRSTGPAFALALAAGEAVGRVGCHFNECCYGRVWDGAIAVVQHGAARFPVQLVSAAWAVCLFFIVLWLRGRMREGRVFPAYLALFATGRFFLEFFRGALPTYGPLTVAQWVCVEIVVSVAVVHAVTTLVQRRQARV